FVAQVSIQRLSSASKARVIQRPAPPKAPGPGTLLYSLSPRRGRPALARRVSAGSTPLLPKPPKGAPCISPARQRREYSAPTPQAPEGGDLNPVLQTGGMKRSS